MTDIEKKKKKLMMLDPKIGRLKFFDEDKVKKWELKKKYTEKKTLMIVNMSFANAKRWARQR